MMMIASCTATLQDGSLALQHVLPLADTKVQELAGSSAIAQGCSVKGTNNQARFTVKIDRLRVAFAFVCVFKLWKKNHTAAPQLTSPF